MTVAESQTAPASKDVDDDNARLIVLRAMVAGVYEGGTPFEVVLQIGGVLVSGTVVSQERWQEALIGDPAVIEEIRKEAPAATGNAEDDGPVNPFKVRNICMVDVELNGAAITRLPAWQVPLARVEGWTTGRVSRGRADDDDHG